MNIEEIMRNRQKTIRISGIYLLFDGDTVVYVGKSIDVEKRIGAHRPPEKIFDSYSIIPYSPKDLDEKEVEYILEYIPKYNKNVSRQFKKGIVYMGKISQSVSNKKGTIPYFVVNNILYADISEVVCGSVLTAWDDDLVE